MWPATRVCVDRLLVFMCGQSTRVSVWPATRVSVWPATHVSAWPATRVSVWPDYSCFFLATSDSPLYEIVIPSMSSILCTIAVL